MSQFCKWKKRKQKMFKIVVTEKGKREMATNEIEKTQHRYVIRKQPKKKDCMQPQYLENSVTK